LDVQYFLKQRTSFVRQFYNTAATLFAERKRKIEAEEEPFVPPYSEDGEPPFLAEWLEADESLHVLGQACLSMLAASLQLYLKTWERNLGLKCKEQTGAAFNRGWFNGYRVCLEQVMRSSWSEGPMDLHLIEEIVLVRNRSQHPNEIHTFRASHSRFEIAKLSRIFFASETEQQLLAELKNSDNPWLHVPPLDLSPERIFAAIAEVEKLAQWLDAKLFAVLYPKHQSEPGL
jgi:hypothetical protein